MTALSTLALLFGAQALCGQTVATEEDLAERMSKAEGILKGRPSVQRITTERAVPGSDKFVYTAREIIEEVPDDRERITAEVVANDGSTEKKVSISIGEVTYAKDGEGPWVKNWKIVGPPAAGMRLSAEYSYIGREVIGGQTTQVFKVKSTFGYRADTPIKNRGGNETTYYFDDIGRLKKKLVVTFNSDGPTARITTVYEYPNAISIEAPIK